MHTARRTFLFALFFSLVILYTLVYFNAESVLYSFSRQGTIDPDTISEELSPEKELAIFNNELLRPPTYLAKLESQTDVLGETTGGNKRIEVDLTNQKLYAYDGSTKVFEFLVSTGKWGKTPTGTFTVWTKLRATKMEGGSKALRTYYYLPNVPYVMFFANREVAKSRGFSTHGTYWHSNFGHPMSHGCVNMKTAEAQQLYNWAYVGIPVVIYGTAPSA